MRKATIGFSLNAIPAAELLAEGVLTRFMGFTIAWTTGLCVALLLTLHIPVLIYLVGFIFPIAWGLGYLYLLIDISRMSRVRLRELGDR